MTTKTVLAIVFASGLTGLVAAAPSLLDRGSEKPATRTRSEAQQRVEWPRDNPPRPLPAIVVTYQVPYNGHPDSYPMFVMSKTLSDGQTSRIYRKLVYETGLALTAFGSSSFLEQPGIFSGIALVNPGKSPDEVEKALIAEFDKLKTQGITERELQRAKNQFARDYIVSRLSIKEKASQLGHAEVIQKDMASADGEFDTFMKVSLEDVKRVAQKYFVPEGRMVMRVMPRGGAK